MDGLMPWLRKVIAIMPQTKICNDADRPILLIPYVALNGTIHEKCSFKSDLARIFKPGVPQQVDRTRYNYRKLGSQIYFLLRAGNRDDPDKDLKNYRKGVTLEKGEKCYIYEHLPNNGEVHLRFDNKGQVIGLADEAGQTSIVSEQAAAGTRTASEAVSLEEIVRLLKYVVECLQERVKAPGSGSSQ